MSKGIFKTMLDLGRAANLPTVWTNVLAAWLLSRLEGAGWLGLSLVPCLIGASLLYLGGCTLNDVCDEEFDRQYRPERAIPAGIMSRQQVLVLAGVELILGAFTLMLAGCDPELVGLLATAIVAYDLWHKKWIGCVWIMGLCRALLWLIPATLPTHELKEMVIIWAVLVGLYVAGISLTARAESKPDGKSSKWTVLFLLVPLAGLGYSSTFSNGSLLGFLTFGMLLWVAVGGALFMVLMAKAVNGMRSDPPASIGPAVALLLAAISLVDAMALWVIEPKAALALLLGLPLARFLQWYVAST